ncbi:RidA family protein [Curtobacterium sp. MCBD17_028]|nr:RidA family protein [Curtobacterium sp. MCBD17_028]
MGRRAAPRPTRRREHQPVHGRRAPAGRGRADGARRVRGQAVDRGDGAGARPLTTRRPTPRPVQVIERKARCRTTLTRSEEDGRVSETTDPKTVTLIRSASLAQGVDYAYAATAPADARLVFLAGACPLDETGATVALGDHAGQAAKCVENMVTALRAAGAGVEDVISTRVLVASSRQADLIAAWDVVRAAFGAHDVPSTLLGVTVLGYDGQLVEIEAVAAVLDR